MRLGVHLPQFREAVPGVVLAAAARDAEEAGADDVWVSDHLIVPAGSERPPEVFHDPLTVLTWAAAATRRVGLGTSVLVAPYRHPVVLARALASLDALSGGRVVCGIASGWMEFEFRALGVPFGERGARTDETIDVMRRLWSGAGDYTWRGERTEGVALRPGPARPGGPPVWVGGNSDAGIRRAVRAGDGWHTTVAHEEGLAERVAALDAALAAGGRDRAGFTLSVRVRADAARVARIAPRMRELGVDHLLVDPPVFSPERFPDEVAALRALV
ncbi:MAG TPA: TIGR03619 family F420-dependent LLM class oxidoreductase [Miltoncostaea sp.]|nr:TIGR03619 family F420-dependent LLM class oxidoreductase [Miltoncostaea sp.]